MKTFLKIAAIVVVALVLVVGGLFWYLFGGLQSQNAGLDLGNGSTGTAQPASSATGRLSAGR